MQGNVCYSETWLLFFWDWFWTVSIKPGHTYNLYFTAMCVTLVLRRKDEKSFHNHRSTATITLRCIECFLTKINGVTFFFFFFTKIIDLYNVREIAIVQYSWILKSHGCIFIPCGSASMTKKKLKNMYTE